MLLEREKQKCASMSRFGRAADSMNRFLTTEKVCVTINKLWLNSKSQRHILRSTAKKGKKRKHRKSKRLLLNCCPLLQVLHRMPGSHKNLPWRQMELLSRIFKSPHRSASSSLCLVQVLLYAWEPKELNLRANEVIEASKPDFQETHRTIRKWSACGGQWKRAAFLQVPEISSLKS